MNSVQKRSWGNIVIGAKDARHSCSVSTANRRAAIIAVDTELADLLAVVDAANKTLAWLNGMANDELCDNDGRGCNTSSHVAEIIPDLAAALAKVKRK